MKTWLSGILRKARGNLLNFVRIRFHLKDSRGRIRLIALRSPPSYVSEYYNYCVSGLLSEIDEKSGSRLAVFLPSQNFQFGDDTKTVIINTEHTLVREGGRDSAGSILGTIPVVGKEDESYLVRIPGGASNLSAADQIIEYSIPNTINLLQSRHKNLFSGKVHNVAPLLSTKMLNPSWQERDLEKIFTLMSLPTSGDRRSEIVRHLIGHGLDIVNISGLVGSTSKRMSSIGILVNLHQTEHHHTLEELRILPALLQGVLVVSEPSPLIENVPYSKFVTFASVEDMPGVISQLMDDYEGHWTKTFASGEFTKVITQLEESNRNAFKEIVKNLML